MSPIGTNGHGRVLAVPDHERAVLSAMMQSREGLVLGIELLEAEDFYERTHRAVWDGLAHVFAHAQEVDALILSEALRQQGTLEGVGGLVFLTGLLTEAVTVHNIRHHARILRDYTLQRHLKKTAQFLQQDIDRGDRPVQEMLTAYQDTLLTLGTGTHQGGFVSFDVALDELSQALTQAHEAHSELMGIPTGFDDLDAMTGGWQSPDLTIIGARPGVGKTSLGLQLAVHAAQQGTHVGIFSLEMSRLQLAQRIVSAHTGIELHRLRQAKLQEEEWLSLTQAMSHLAQLPLHIDDGAGLSITDARARCLRLSQRFPIGLWMFDYLQLMTASGDSENERVNKISTGLKAIAKETQAPVLGLSQLSRACESRPDKKPQLSDLRSSGGIEQDADNVLLIYRPGIYGDRIKSANGQSVGHETRLLIEKQRNGPTGAVDLLWVPESAHFVSMAPNWHQEPPPHVGVRDGVF